EDENAKEMPPVNDTCPTCNQTLPTGDIEKQKEEITKKWNQNLLDVKATIEADGKRFNQDLKAKNSDIEAQKALIAEKKAELKSISEELHSFIEEPVEPEVDIKPLILAALEKHVEYNQLKADAAKIQEELSKPIEIDQASKEETDAKKADKYNIQTVIDALNQQLGVKTTITKNKQRIDELELQ